MEETKVSTVDQRCPDFYKEKLKVSKKTSFLRDLYKNFLNHMKKQQSQ